MWEKILLIIVSIYLIYISYQVGIKGNFKHTHIENEWLKNLEVKELEKFKRGVGLSYLIIGVIVISFGITTSSKILAIGVILTVLIVINLFRISVKYMYFK